MLIVKGDQRAAMWPALLRQRVVARVKEGFPEDFTILGAEVVGRAVDFGIARAAGHGFFQGDEVEKYVDLMFLLGSYFDEDPLLPWAAHILRDPAITSPFVRIHNLEITAAKHLRKTTGEDGEHYMAALVRARRTRYEELVKVRSDDPATDVLLLLHWLYPEQYATLSKPSLAGLGLRVASAAEAHHMASREGRVVLVSLMFLLGSFFDRDLLQPWAVPAFAEPGDANAKARALHAAALARLDRYRLVASREGGDQ